MLLIGRAVWEICFSQSEALPRSVYWCTISMEFLRLFLRHHFAGKSVVEWWNVGCFLRLWKVKMKVNDARDPSHACGGVTINHLLSCKVRAWDPFKTYTWRVTNWKLIFLSLFQTESSWKSKDKLGHVKNPVMLPGKFVRGRLVFHRQHGSDR